MAIFEGSAVALVLPMHEDGSIDYDGFKRQVQRMIDGGVKALLVNGTTGETATIHIDDEFKLLDITLEMAQGTGIKVIAGAGSNDTATALKKAKYAKEKGADAILVVTPYYNKTSQRGLIAHYTTIADAVDIPMILYNVPGRTGVKIKVETVVELAKHKNIVAMKDATDDIAYAMENKKKMKQLHAVLLITGIPLNIIQWVSIILWITTGIQWLFWGYILVAIPYAIFIIRFLSKRIVYICPQCHEIFKPHLKEFIFSNHSMTLRKLTCTSCGYHGFCVETYREEEKNNE